MSEVIHVAGFPVRVGSKIRQRCAWCDYVFTDSDLADMATAPDENGVAPDLAKTWWWQPGDLIGVDGHISRLIGHRDDYGLPLSCCASQPVEAWAIEFRSGSHFQDEKADRGGPVTTAQKFESKAEARAFMEARQWMMVHGPMPVQVEWRDGEWVRS